MEHIEDVAAALEEGQISEPVEEPNAEELVPVDKGSERPAEGEKGQEEQRDQAEPETPQAEPGAPEGDVKGPEAQVNYGALHEERGKRKELEDQLSSATQRMTRMEAAFAKVTQDLSPDGKPSTFPIEPVPGQAPQTPAYDEDPGGHLLGQFNILNEAVRGLTQKIDQGAAAQQQSGAQDAMMRTAMVEVNSYKTVQPDWNDAYEHLLKVNTEQLSAQGYAPAQVAQIMGQMERNIIGMAQQAGVNPGRRLYEAAQANGYVKNGTPAVTPPAPPGEQIQALAAQAEQTKSLGDAAGAPAAPGEGTLEHLATLQGAEFDKQWAVMKRKGKL